jgi:hypothetical protein
LTLVLSGDTTTASARGRNPTTEDILAVGLHSAGWAFLAGALFLFTPIFRRTFMDFGVELPRTALIGPVRF